MDRKRIFHMRTLVFLLSLATAFACSADRQPPAGFCVDATSAITAAASVTTARFPNADRVLVNNHVSEIVEKDGTSVHWDDEYTKVLTEKGRRDASSADLFFDAHYGTAMVCRAEIIRPDGHVVPIDTSVYSRIMTEPGQMGANIYDPASKILSISLPGLEIGDTYHLLTCDITFKTRMPDTWSDYTLFESDMPILRFDYDVSTPPELPLCHTVLRSSLSNTVIATESKLPDGRTLHAWHVRNVPQMFPEPDMPPVETQVQRLILSTIKDWRTVSRWYWKLCQPALEKVTPEMRAKVESLTVGAETREEKIRRIFKFVSQEIRYMGITAEDVAPGYEPHDVSLTFHNRYGVCRDKAALLAALLRLSGVPAYPVLINATAKMDPDVPIPYFNHAITAVDKPGGGYELMDPTDENTRDLFPSYLCNRSYLVAKPEGETLLVSDVYPAEKNLTRIDTHGTLDETGALLLKTKIMFEGINDNAYRGHFLRQKAEQRRKFFEAVLKGRLSGAEVLECTLAPEDLQDTDTPLSASLTVRVPDYPVRGNGLDLVTLPWLGTAIGYANFVIGQTGLNVRRFPMETGITCGVDEQIVIDTANNLGTPYVLPPDVRFDQGGVSFSMLQKVENGKLTGKLRYLLKTPEFSPADYLALKKSMREIETASRHRPLFVAQNEQRAPDHELLRDDTDARLIDDHTWVTTQTSVKRVLTYAGKKKDAELKYSFAPVWQNVEVVSATVSNVNGTVYKVTPKEINVMDEPWVSSAPRYPAEKTLVVTLPGVETGSVITVTTRHTQTNGCFYSHQQAFGGTEPSDEETYRLSFPRSRTPAIQTYHFQAISFTAQTNGDDVVWTWHTTKPPVVRVEEQLPPWHFYQPTLFVSFGSWNAYAHQLRRVTASVSEHDREARRHAKALVKGIRDPRERILAIRNDVLRTIRPAGPSFISLPPTSLSTPDRTLADQYGHAADRALLLADMLDAAGFDAEIILAGNDTTAYPACSQPLREVPQYGFFQNPLVVVSSSGKTYYLNEGDQYDELGTSAADRAPALSLSGKIQTVSVADSYRSMSKNEWTIDLAANGSARITVTNLFFGPSAGRFRKEYSEMLPEDRHRHYLELVGDIAKSARPASDFVTDTSSYPCLRTYSVIADNYATIDGNTLTLLIPEVAGAIFPLRADRRENPVFLSLNDTSDLTCRIILPPGFTRLPVLPASKQWTLPNGFGTLDYRVGTAVRQDGRSEVCITRALKRFSAKAAPELYPALLEYNHRLTHPSNRTLVAERSTP